MQFIRFVRDIFVSVVCSCSSSCACLCSPSRVSLDYRHAIYSFAHAIRALYVAINNVSPRFRARLQRGNKISDLKALPHLATIFSFSFSFSSYFSFFFLSLHEFSEISRANKSRSRRTIIMPWNSMVAPFVVKSENPPDREI